MGRRDTSHTLTLEEWKAANEKKDLGALRRAGADLSAYTSMPESQVCTPSKPCEGEYVCSKHRPQRSA